MMRCKDIDSRLFFPRHYPILKEMKKMGLPMKRADHKFTYVDYSMWPDDERWELIDGAAYNMSPAPTSRHQNTSSFLAGELYLFLKNRPCKVFSAPFDIYFPEYPDQNFNSIDSIVQPDISVICDPDKIIEKGCLGAPDLIIEILSPATANKDMYEKFHLYEKQGVKEYWIVDPGNKYIRVFHLQIAGRESGKYDEGTLIPPADWREENSLAESRILEGFTVDTAELFKES
jgi:Uma2 family endonuclease